MASWDDGKHRSVRKVQISYSDSVINSIKVDYDSSGNLLSAPQRGGTGNRSAEFSLSFPEEYLTEVTGYYSNTISGEVITGLTFKTNRRTLGPYGTKTRTYFSINLPKDNHVIGFHGKSGNVLNALEVHYGPIPAGGTGAGGGQGGSTGTPTTPPTGGTETETGGTGTGGTSTGGTGTEGTGTGGTGTGGTGTGGTGTDGTPGTGGTGGNPGTGTGGTPGTGGDGGKPDGLIGGNGGLDWDDSDEHSGIRKIEIGYDNTAIHSITIGYDETGSLVQKQRRGGTGGKKVPITFNFPNAYLIAVSGYYSKLSPTSSETVIKSLTFVTSNAQYGPYGEETGTAFQLLSPNESIVGFRGRSGAYLDAIGAHYGPVPTSTPSGTGSDAGTGTGTDTGSGSGTGSIPGTGTGSGSGTGNTPGTGTGASAGSGEAAGGLASGGLFGGNGGLDWDDSDEYSGVAKFIIGHDESVIHSITVTYDQTGTPMPHQRRGGTGGKIIPITFEFPNEYLIYVSGHYSKWYSTSPEIVIKSLTLITNNKQYGPYGEQTGTPFELMMPNKSIIGFRGRSGAVLNAIGVHYGPIPDSTATTTTTPVAPSTAATEPSVGPGPFGSPGGLDWDDKDEYSGVKRINIGHDDSFIHSITVTYDDTGSTMQAQRRGGDGGNRLPVEIKFPDEYLISVSGTYTDSSITSLTLETNKTKYGPYGRATGKSFILKSPGKQIIGFRGTSGAYLNTLGAHFGAIPVSTTTPGAPATAPEPSVGPGPFGSPGGLDWDDGDQYSGVKKIDVGHDNSLVHSITVTYDDTGSTMQAQRRGGAGGNRLSVEIKFPEEYLISVSGTYSDSGITSLAFETNKTKYGPYGQATGKSFVLKSPGKQIIGFCGTSGGFLNTLGAHFDAIPASSSTPSSQTLDVPGVTSEASGGNGGNPWDDGIFDNVRKIYVGPGSDGIHSLRFDYDLNAQLVKGQEHGQTQIPPDEISLDYPKEYLTSVEGQSDNMPGYDGPIIQSVKFKTNLGREFGPFGYQTGNQFLFENKGGKIVGFHGRASTVIHNIGVHIKPANT